MIIIDDQKFEIDFFTEQCPDLSNFLRYSFSYDPSKERMQQLANQLKDSYSFDLPSGSKIVLTPLEILVTDDSYFGHKFDNLDCINFLLAKKPNQETLLTAFYRAVEGRHSRNIHRLFEVEQFKKVIEDNTDQIVDLLIYWNNPNYIYEIMKFDCVINNIPILCKLLIGCADMNQYFRLVREILTIDGVKTQLPTLRRALLYATAAGDMSAAAQLLEVDIIKTDFETLMSTLMLAIDRRSSKHSWPDSQRLFIIELLLKIDTLRVNQECVSFALTLALKRGDQEVVELFKVLPNVPAIIENFYIAQHAILQARIPDVEIVETQEPEPQAQQTDSELRPVSGQIGSTARQFNSFFANPESTDEQYEEKWSCSIQ